MACLVVAGWSAVSRSPLAAQTLDQARELHLAGRWAEARDAYLQLAAEHRGRDPETAAIALNNACLVLVQLADYRAALAACEEALALRRDLPDERRLARVRNNLGLVLQHLGRYAEAGEQYRAALTLNEARGDLEAQAVNRVNLGVVATWLGRYTEAMDLYGQVVRLAEAHAAEPWAAEQRAVALLNEGVVLEKLGAYREALDLYAGLVADSPELAPARRTALQVNMGTLYRNLGDPVRAVAMFQQAIATYRQQGDAAALSNALLNLGLAWHLNLDRRVEAEAAYREALALAEQSGDRSELLQDLVHLGRLLLEDGRWTEAAAMWERCLAEAEASDVPEGRWAALAGLARLAGARGEPEQALELYERALAEIETVRAGLAGGALRAGYFGDKREVYGAAVQVLAELDRLRPGGGFAERALAVAQRAKARELVDVLGGGATALPSLAALQTALGEDLLLEYFVAQPPGAAPRLLLWVAGGGRPVRLFELGPAEPVTAAVSMLHRQLAAGEEVPAVSLASLATTLLAPSELAPARFARLWIAADGRLRYLPFELLPLPGGEGRLLLERATVSYLPSGATLARLPRPAPDLPGGLLGFGDPRPAPASATGRAPAEVLASRFALRPLPAAARELGSAAGRLGQRPQLFLGAAATEAAFRGAVARGARVVHLATHTVVDEGMGKGAAVLLSPDGEDDGLLYPEEIATLDYRAELTVLAACSTALAPAGDQGGLVALTGSFLAAGSPAVVATLWDVDDQAAAVFMEQFYYQLSRGLDAAEALRRTKQRLRQDAGWAAPHLWAGYVLVGNAPGHPLLPVWLVPLLVLTGAAGTAVATLAWRRRRAARSRADDPA